MQHTNHCFISLYVCLYKIASCHSKERHRNNNKVKEMFTYIFIILYRYILYVSCASDLLSKLWDEENAHLSASLTGAAVPDAESKLLISRLSKLPFTNKIKSDVWYKLLRYRSVENLHVMEWQQYEPLIPYLPLSLLRKVNFTDQEILTYFGQLELSQFQLPQLAEEAIMRMRNVFDEEDEIFKLGNIICGFTQKEMSTIKESVLRSLLEKNFFRSITACSLDQLAYLSKLVKQYTVIGPPRTWQPETVKQAGHLISGLQPIEIREIRDKSFSQISPDVIDLAPLNVLRAVKNSQLKTLSKSALLTWRRKTRDLRELYMSESSCSSVKMTPAVVLPTLLSTIWKDIT